LKLFLTASCGVLTSLMSDNPCHSTSSRGIQLPHPAVVLSLLVITILAINPIPRCSLPTSCRLFLVYALFLHPAESARPCETHTKAIAGSNKVCNRIALRDMWYRNGLMLNIIYFYQLFR